MMNTLKKSNYTPGLNKTRNLALSLTKRGTRFGSTRPGLMKQTTKNYHPNFKDFIPDQKREKLNRAV